MTWVPAILTIVVFGLLYKILRSKPKHHESPFIEFDEKADRYSVGVFSRKR